MKAISKIAILLSVAVFSSSCIKEKLEETYNKQDEQIDKYITGLLEKNESYTATYNDGVSRLTTKSGEGPELSSNGSISFYYAGYTFSGSINPASLFGTNHQATAEMAQWNLTDPDYSLLEVSLKDKGLLEGVRKGLIGAQAGEECEILFSGKHGFGNSTFGIIPAKSALAFKIWVVGVSND